MNAAILCRVSTSDQSTESQEQVLINKANELGYNVPTNLIFSEKITGLDKYNIDRKSISDLRAACERGGIDAIIVGELSRLSRNPTALNQMLALFVEVYKIPLYINDMRLWTINPLTKEVLMDNVNKLITYSTYGYEEVMKIRERTKRGRDYKAKQGYSVGTMVYGYKITTNTKTKEKFIEVDEEQAEVVRTIFNMYNEGKSLMYITRYLRGNGIKTMLGCEWQTARISCMLRLKWYIGERDYKGIKNTHTPIIDRNLFDAVQRKMEKPKRSTTKHRYYALTGIIECGDCSKKFYGATTKRAALYVCDQRVGGDCSNSINKFFIDGIVWGVIKNRLLDNENFNDLMSFFKLNENDIEKLQTELDNTNAIIEGLNKSNKDLNKQLVSYYKDRAKTQNKASLNALNGLIEETEKSIESNEKLISNYINEVNQIVAKIEGNKDIEKTFENPIATINQLEDKDKIRELIHKIVSKIVVYRNRDYRVIKIIYTNGRSEDIIYNGRNMRGHYIHLSKGMYYEPTTGMVINPNMVINYDATGYYIGKSDREDTSYTNVLEGKELKLEDAHTALIMARKKIERIEPTFI